MFIIRYSDDEIRLLRRFIKGYVLGILRPIKPEHIDDFANRNKVPNISVFINSLPEFALKKIHNIVKDSPDLIDKWISTKYLIRKIGESRLDIQECLKDPKKRIWLEKFIEYTKSCIRKI